MSKILESGFESVVLTLLAQMGFTCHGGDAFDPDASGERESYHGAMLPGRLKAAVARINPELSTLGKCWEIFTFRLPSVFRRVLARFGAFFGVFGLFV